MHNPPDFPPHTNDVHFSAGESCVVAFGFCFQCSQAKVTQGDCGKARGARPHSLCHGMCFLAKGTQTFCHGLKICENICKSATNRLKLLQPHFFGHFSWGESSTDTSHRVREPLVAPRLVSSPSGRFLLLNTEPTCC